MSYQSYSVLSIIAAAVGVIVIFDSVVWRCADIEV